MVLSFTENYNLHASNVTELFQETLIQFLLKANFPFRGTMVIISK